MAKKECSFCGGSMEKDDFYCPTCGESVEDIDIDGYKSKKGNHDP